MNHLEAFYRDAAVRDSVRAYLLAQLREAAADRAMLGGDTSGFKEAGEAIDGAFLGLKKAFEKEKPKQREGR